MEAGTYQRRLGSISESARRATFSVPIIDETKKLQPRYINTVALESQPTSIVHISHLTNDTVWIVVVSRRSNPMTSVSYSGEESSATMQYASYFKPPDDRGKMESYEYRNRTILWENLQRACSLIAIRCSPILL